MKKVERRDLVDLVMLIQYPVRDKCLELLRNHKNEMLKLPGSSSNHQFWRGGYWDHIEEAMNFGLQLWFLCEGTGRMQYIQDAKESPFTRLQKWHEDYFTLSDVLLCIFLHDIEKLYPKPVDKGQRAEFRRGLIMGLGIELTNQQWLGIKYAEGQRDSEYSPTDRGITPLGTIVHMADLMSARVFFNFPIMRDPWDGATRRGVKVD